MSINLNYVYAIGIASLVFGILYFAIAKLRNIQSLGKIIGHSLFVMLATLLVSVILGVTIVSIITIGSGMIVILPIIAGGPFLLKVYQYSKQDFGFALDATKFNQIKMRGLTVHLFVMIGLLAFLMMSIIYIGMTGFTPIDILFIVLPVGCLIKVIQFMMKEINKPQ